MTFPFKQLPDQERFALRMGDASTFAGLSRTTLYKLVDRGQIESVKVGNRRLILRKSLEDLLSGRGVAEDREAS